MSSIYGKSLHISIFGQSHAEAVGVTLDGLPCGYRISREELAAFMERRAPGRSALSTGRYEPDVPEIVCGLVEDTTCGAPLTVLIRNTDARPQDYASMRDIPRPGHADYTAALRWNGYADLSGGGHLSGRLTAPLCAAGGICLQILQRNDIRITARPTEIGGVSGSREEMEDAIRRAAEEGDSVGGIIECCAEGVPAGLGDPIFDGMENRIASIVFAIPAVKGIEFGSGFAAARLRGSENNDPFTAEDGEIRTETNRHGGILGGITSGMPLVFRVAVKPTPSIAKPQRSVTMSTCEETVLRVAGRHDPCIVPRAVPCVEAACAAALLDTLLDDGRLPVKE